MVEQALSYFVASTLLLLVSQIHSVHSGDFKVLISKSGSAKLGEITAFDAEVVLNSKARTRTRHASYESITYEFFWKVPSGPWIKHSKTTHRWDSFRWRWSSGGQKIVAVYVRILVGSYPDSTDEQRYHNGYSSYYARNQTDVTVTGSDDVIIASLDAHQDSPVIKNGSNTYHETFIAGMVHLEVIIRKPQDLDLDGIKFDWYFGDGSQLNHSQLQNVTHNFTTVESCTINVYIYGWSLGRYYSGTASKTLKFTANVQPYLEIKTSAGPKLPPGYSNAIAKNSPVTFEVKFKDPFEVITGVSIDWKFGDGASVIGRKNTSIVHMYDEEGCYKLWVTIRVNTKYFGKKPLNPIVIFKTLYVKERVFLAVHHKHVPEDKRVIFNISCNGSLPVSFHWCVSKQCHLPPGDICSPTVEHKNSCSLIINHMFRDPGKYCVNVGVMNDVSGTNTSLVLQIPDDSGPAQQSTGKNSAGMFVSLFVAILLIIIVMVIVARKWIYTRREKSEKADFDFRDEDTASLSSLDLYGKRSCFPRCKLLGSCTRKEYVPLRIQAGECKRYTQ